MDCVFECCFYTNRTTYHVSHGMWFCKKKKHYITLHYITYPIINWTTTSFNLYISLPKLLKLYRTLSIHWVIHHLFSHKNFTPKSVKHLSVGNIFQICFGWKKHTPYQLSITIYGQMKLKQLKGSFSHLFNILPVWFWVSYAKIGFYSTQVPK